MAKKSMDDLLKRRMSATQQAFGQVSELQATDEAYAKIFREAPPKANARICDLPLDKLVSFHTADIGFKPYTQAQLQAFADQLNEEGLMVRIIVRSVADGDIYEILAGHNRTNAARLAGWTERQAVFTAWHEARAHAEERLAARPKKISFDRKQFAPYLDKLGSERELEKLFLAFLQERVG